MGQPAPLPKLTEPANKGPTLEETQQWLIKTYRENGALITHEPEEILRYDLHFSGCNLSVLQLIRYTNTNITYIRADLSSGSLLDMDPEFPSVTIGKSDRFQDYPQQTYKYTSPHVNLAFQGDINALRDMRLLLLANKPNNRKTYLTSIYYYPSPQMVPRINNVWPHAIKLCVEQAAAARNAESVKPAGELF
jgi:hypothetical protein